MPDKNDFLIENSRNFVSVIVDRFIENAEKKLDEYKDTISPEMRKKIEFFTITDLTHCIVRCTDTADKDATMTRNQLIDHVQKYQEEWVRRNALTTTYYHEDKDGILHVDNIHILIKKDSIYQYIVENMYRLPMVVEELIDITPYHEAGHAIDNIQLIEGANAREYEEKFNKPDKEAYDQYYKWRKEFIETLSKDKFDVEGHKLNYKKYYQIPAEARADILGGIDRDAVLNKLFDTMSQESHVEVRGLSEEVYNRLLEEYKKAAPDGGV